MFRRPRLLPICALLLATATHADGLRDPMRPAGSAPAAPRALTVQSLRLEGVIGGEQRVAIINGRPVRAGDVVAGAKIVEILANGVRYERAGKSFTLTLAAAQANSAVRIARSQEK
jgi:MSHA biogenesis protein MshK